MTCWALREPAVLRVTPNNPTSSRPLRPEHRSHRVCGRDDTRSQWNAFVHVPSSAHFPLLLNDENPSSTTVSGRFCHVRDHDPEFRPFSRPALYRNRAAQVLDQVSRFVKSHPDAGAVFLRGKEGFEDALLRHLVHAAPVVFDLDHKTISPCLPGTGSEPDCGILLVGGLGCVEEDGNQDLFQSIGIADNGTQDSLPSRCRSS